MSKVCRFCDRHVDELVRLWTDCEGWLRFESMCSTCSVEYQTRWKIKKAEKAAQSAGFEQGLAAGRKAAEYQMSLKIKEAEEAGRKAGFEEGFAAGVEAEAASWGFGQATFGGKS